MIPDLEFVRVLNVCLCDCNKYENKAVLFTVFNFHCERQREKKRDVSLMFSCLFVNYKQAAMYSYSSKMQLNGFEKKGLLNYVKIGIILSLKNQQNAAEISVSKYITSVVTTKTKCLKIRI